MVIELSEQVRTEKKRVFVVRYMKGKTFLMQLSEQVSCLSPIHTGRYARGEANQDTVHTAHNKQRMMQQASEWDLAPFIRITRCIASSVDGAFALVS